MSEGKLVNALTYFRVDGRRNHELRYTRAELATHTSMDGSSYLEHGNTRVICCIQGFYESTTTTASSNPATSAMMTPTAMPTIAQVLTSSKVNSGNTIPAHATCQLTADSVPLSKTSVSHEAADIRVDVHIATYALPTLGGGGGGSSGNGFSGNSNGIALSSTGISNSLGGSGSERKRMDKTMHEFGLTLATALEGVVLRRAHPRSTLSLSFYVIANDGGLLAALVNAATMALVDAGIPIYDYLVACTAGYSVISPRENLSDTSPSKENLLPLLDLTRQEELESPYLTVATLGSTDRIVLLDCTTRFNLSYLDKTLLIALGGCREMRRLLDNRVRQHAHRYLSSAAAMTAVTGTL